MIVTYSFGEFLSSYILLYCKDVTGRYKIDIKYLEKLANQIERDCGIEIDFSTDSKDSCFYRVKKGISLKKNNIVINNIQMCVFYLTTHNSKILQDKITDAIMWEN